MNTFYDFMKSKIKECDGDKKEIVTTGVKCLVCHEGEIVEKFGKFGKFYSCSKYPDCKTSFVRPDVNKNEYAVKEKKEQVKTGQKCSVCKKGDIIERSGQYGPWYACNQFPKCKTVFEKNGDSFVQKAPKWAKKKEE